MKKSLKITAVLSGILLAAGFSFTSCSNISNSDSDFDSELKTLTRSVVSNGAYAVSNGMAGAVSAGTSIVNGSVSIKGAQGWLESAYVSWYGISCDSYNVYYKKSSDSSWTKADSMLTRKYNGFWRADLLGLAQGTYTVKVVPVKNGSEFGTASTVSVKVASHDRTGFAFQGSKVPGAYNADGTLKSNAVVLYISEKTKDTVSLDVVTSAKGAVTNAVGLQNILTLFKKGYDNRPLCIRLIGNVSDFASMDNGDIMISGSGDTKRISNGITFEGVGDDAVANGWGLRVKNASYVEVRNIGWMNCDSAEGDDVSLQQSCDYCWVHNNDMFYGEAGGDADQKKGDGALDCKKSTFITFSYNHFWDNGKCNLLGLSEGTTDGLYITYHHNWYDHSDSRHPRVRFYSAHVYNNYYDGNAKYGAGACLGSSVFMDSNYFRNCKYPMMASMQGTDVYGSGTKRDPANLGTFSKENGGSIKSFNNKMTGTYYYVPYGSASSKMDTKVDFDCYEVSSKSQTVPSSVKSYAGGNTYNNFDTSSVMYSWNADAPDSVPSIVKTFAGRMQGGDFKFTFTDADDAKYDLNTALKSALESYKGSIEGYNGSASSTVDTNKGQDDVNTTPSTPSTPSSPVEEEKPSTPSTPVVEETPVTPSTPSTDTGSSITSEAALKAEGLSTGTLTANTTYGDFTVLANSSKTVKINSQALSYNSNSYTKCFDLGGGADGVAPTYRAIKFNVQAGSSITIVANAGSARTLNLSNGSAVVKSVSVGTGATALNYTAEKSGTYYVYSAGSSIRVYEVYVAAPVVKFDTIEANADSLSHGTFSSNATSGKFTIYATSAKTVSTPYSSASLNGKTFKQTIALGGGGAYGSYRAIGFDAVAGCKVTVYASGAAGRYLALVNANGVVSKQEVSSSIASYTFTVPADGNYNIMSTASGINVFYVNVSK